jgi:hypothetical protein
VTWPEHTELPRPIAADAAACDDARKGDRHTQGFLLGEQARAVPLRVFPGQVPHFQPADPDRHRIRVIGIVVFGDQHGADVLAHTLFAWVGSGQMPQVGLVKGLADHLQVLVAVQQRSLRAVPHPARPLIRLAASLVRPDMLATASLTPENPHVWCPLPNSAGRESQTLHLFIHRANAAGRAER